MFTQHQKNMLNLMDQDGRFQLARDEIRFARQAYDAHKAEQCWQHLTSALDCLKAVGLAYPGAGDLFAKVANKLTVVKIWMYYEVAKEMGIDVRNNQVEWAANFDLTPDEWRQSLTQLQRLWGVVFVGREA